MQFMKVLLSLIALFSSILVFSQDGKWCKTDQIIKEQKASNVKFEELLHSSLKNAAKKKLNNEAKGDVIEIPTVIHIIHDNGIGNISDDQIYSALEVLNTDYNRLNADTSSTRQTALAPFKQNAGSMDIAFKLAKLDPQGNCTNGIVRVNAPHLTYSAGEDCKYTSNGGSDGWPKDNYFNIWVVNTIDSEGAAGTIAGYAYYPYGASTNDGYGILMDNSYFGTVGTASNEDGRVLTHEMGHALGLPHIFDEVANGSGCHTGDCFSEGDYSCDTPPQSEANWSCSQTYNSCSEIPLNDAFGFDAYDQIENYMSYNYCQNMFSLDQVNIMQNNFVDISFLSNLKSPSNLIATGINEPDQICYAAFEAYNRVICSGDVIPFHDYSFSNPTDWSWSITPGVPGVDYDFVNGTSAISKNPEITFITSGHYSVSLNVTDGVGNASETKTDYIQVLPTDISLPFAEGFESYNLLNDTEIWSITNIENNNAFNVFSQAGHNSNKSLKLANFGQFGENTDELISGPIDLSVVDPSSEIVTLSFRYSYRKRVPSNDEWLKVFISRDCGDNWTQRKTIHGDALNSNSTGTPWLPTVESDWTTVHMTNVTSSYFVKDFRVKFEFEGSGGNNFFLDNINIYKGAPSDALVDVDELVNENFDFTIFPNPADDELNLRLSVNASSDFKGRILDVTGKEIRMFDFNQLVSSNQAKIEISDLTSGVYFIQLDNYSLNKTKRFIVK